MCMASQTVGRNREIGRLLLPVVPNVSKRLRQFSSVSYVKLCRTPEYVANNISIGNFAVLSKTLTL